MFNDAPVRPVYAAFWRRAAAALLDGCLLLAILLGVGHAIGRPGLLLRDDWFANLAAGLVGLVYAAGFESSRWQATPGKRVLGIKVTDLAGCRIDPVRALLRHVAQLLSAACLLVGYVMAAFTRRRQCLHDLIAGTLVVRADCSPDEIATAPPARAWSRWMIAAVVAPIVATWLLLLVLGTSPATAPDAAGRSRYHARTEVTAALYYASDAIDTAESLYGEARDFASVNVPSVELDEEASHTIAALGIVAGSIRITFGGESDAVLQGHTATLTPAVDEAGNITWICGYADVPNGYDPIRDDYRSLTDVTPDALPPDCLPDDAAADAPSDAPGLKA
jgi:uncharacterized RDD family membrane protein YckC